MATTDDFTFQITTTPHSCLVDSPPVWHPTYGFASASASPSCSEINTYDGEKVVSNMQRRSFSYIERGVSEEERMDMLWQDLNDEISQRVGSEMKFSDSPGRIVKFGCVRGVAVVKKPGTVSILKVLKKLFLLHSSRRSLRKRNL